MPYAPGYSGTNRRGKRTTFDAGGPNQGKTSRGIGKRWPDFPSPPKPSTKKAVDRSATKD